MSRRNTIFVALESLLQWNDKRQEWVVDKEVQKYLRKATQRGIRLVAILCPSQWGLLLEGKDEELQFFEYMQLVTRQYTRLKFSHTLVVDLEQGAQALGRYMALKRIEKQEAEILGSSSYKPWSTSLCIQIGEELEAFGSYSWQDVKRHVFRRLESAFAIA